jgi:hypothetical protein
MRIWACMIDSFREVANTPFPIGPAAVATAVRGWGRARVAVPAHFLGRSHYARARPADAPVAKPTGFSDPTNLFHLNNNVRPTA